MSIIHYPYNNSIINKNYLVVKRNYKILLNVSAKYTQDVVVVRV